MRGVPEEAEVVRKIYKMYLSGCGCPEIAKELNCLRVPRDNQTGAWYPYGVSYILRNVTYTGDQLWQKTFATDVLPFKQIKNRGQKPQYYAEQCGPVIIGRQEFDEAQELMRKKQDSLDHVGERPLPRR